MKFHNDEPLVNRFKIPESNSSLVQFIIRMRQNEFRARKTFSKSPIKTLKTISEITQSKNNKKSVINVIPVYLLFIAQPRAGLLTLNMFLSAAINKVTIKSLKLTWFQFDVSYIYRCNGKHHITQYFDTVKLRILRQEQQNIVCHFTWKLRV